MVFDNGSLMDDNDRLVGFVHHRFVVEEDVPVAYMYELQLESCAQGQGLGKFLMQLIELIARKVIIYFCFLFCTFLLFSSNSMECSLNLTILLLSRNRNAWKVFAILASILNHDLNHISYTPAFFFLKLLHNLPQDSVIFCCRKKMTIQ
jgi:GNAT superfamily N-acetyltransferase